MNVVVRGATVMLMLLELGEVRVLELVERGTGVIEAMENRLNERKRQIMGKESFSCTIEHARA